MTESGEWVIQITGINVSFVEGVFKSFQGKLSQKLLEKGVKVHVASQYSPNVKRNNDQPYKFIIRNIWDLESLVKALPDGMPESQQGFGPVKAQPLGTFKLIKAELKEEHNKYINEIKQSGKMSDGKVFVCFQSSNVDRSGEIIEFLEVLKTFLEDKFQGYCLYKKFMLKANEKNEDKFWDYLCEVFVEENTQEIADHVGETLKNFESQKNMKIIYGLFSDFNSIQQ